MKKIILASTFVFCLVPSVFGQDYYTREERDFRLRKAQENMPALSETVKRPVEMVHIMEDSTAYQGWRAVSDSPVQTFYGVSLKAESSFVVDFGEHVTGYFTFAVTPMNRTPDAPARIRFTFGEVPSEIMTPFDTYRNGLSRAWLQDETVTVMTVPDTITISRRLAFRYVKVELIHAPNYDFAISDMSCRAVTSASSTPEPLPPSTPQIIREIDRVGLNTLKECMQTVYEDGPKRDQRLWIGDLYLEALANTYSYRNHNLTKRCLYLIAGLADGSGFLNGTVFERPHPHPQAKQLLMDYALLYNVALKDYLEATKDYETAGNLWGTAKKQLDIIGLYLQDNGLMDFEKANKEWWIFIDWRDGLHREVALQGVAVYALKQTYELAVMLGREKELAHVPNMIRKMTDGARRYFYDKKTGLFIGAENKQVSCHSQLWMILSGVADKAEAQRALTALRRTENAVLTGTPYAFHYYIQALIHCGMNREAKDALIEYWGGMVRKGADTFWETYDPGNDLISPYGFHPMNSYCHAWSCTPVYFIRKYPEIFQ
ncbi:MAG: glycoside hydrolase [Tannerella sp.]|nr:glycoside hydrolase [Tannerella sp.]